METLKDVNNKGKSRNGEPKCGFKKAVKKVPKPFVEKKGESPLVRSQNSSSLSAKFRTHQISFKRAPFSPKGGTFLKGF